MICPYCGQENPADLERCDFCGGSLQATVEQPAQPMVEIIRSPVETQEPNVDAAQTTPETQERGFSEIPPPPPPSGGIYSNRVWWVVGCVVFLCILLGCAASVFALYRYTQVFSFLSSDKNEPQNSSTPVVTLIAIPTQGATSINSLATPSNSGEAIPGILFYDDFSDISSGWDRVDESNYSTNYFTGAYRITVNNDMSDSWANPADHDFRDVSIEADATKNSGPDDNDFGLICRYLDTEHFYYAVISSDGYYGITKVTSESSELLGHDNLVYSDVINLGLATNHIRFDCVGSELTLYANGEMLDQQSDTVYTHGNVGLLAGTYTTPGTDILFDNFGVYTP